MDYESKESSVFKTVKDSNDRFYDYDKDENLIAVYKTYTFKQLVNIATGNFKESK